MATNKPLLLITGASGNLGRSIAGAFVDDFQVVGMDRKAKEGIGFPMVEADLSSDESVQQALQQIADRYGRQIAAVIHLIAYFDSSGEENPLYETVNVEGTRRLLKGLRNFEVERFVYASTMLVHAPGRPGETINEDSPYGPLYVYPRSKLAAEEAIRAEHGDIPFVFLRFAGVYDEYTAVPTLAQQIARIYERDFESYFYSASPLVGQSMLHRDDMVDAVRRTVERRRDLPAETALLIGESQAFGYDALQDEIGYLIHGQEDWPTLRLPKAVAAAGAWAQAKLEPAVPDALDQGEEPFIRPYMVAMSDAHYALDIRRAHELLGWWPQHDLKNTLPDIVAALKRDPLRWYKANGMTPPPAVAEAAEKGHDSEALRAQNEAVYRAEHAENRWAHFVNMALGTWLLVQAPLLGLDEPLLRWAEFLLGAALILFAGLSLSWQMNFARWRTMPWLVLLFGLLVVPLGIVSITFVIIQPIVIGTWSTLALIGAAAMLLQIPYSLDELLAVLQFLRRRMKAGKSLLRVFLFGDTDDGERERPGDEFDRQPGPVLAEVVQGGVRLPWTLWLAALIGVWLLFTRVTLGAEGAMANADHLIGALVLTVLSVAAAEVARAARFLLIPLGVALLVTPFLLDAQGLHLGASVVAGLALIALSIPRGKVSGSYGSWDRMIV